MATEEDKTNSGALLTLVAVSTFAMIAVTLAVTAIARDEVSKIQEEKEGPGASQYHELRRSQQGSLANGVSIEQSMQQVVQGLARDPGSATPAPTASAIPATTGGALAAGGAPAAGAEPAPGGAPGGAVMPATPPANVGAKPAGAERAQPVAPPAKPVAPPAQPVAPPAKPVVPSAKPLAPQPATGQPSPALPPAPPHG